MPGGIAVVVLLYRSGCARLVRPAFHAMSSAPPAPQTWRPHPLHRIGSAGGLAYGGGALAQVRSGA
ncbi:hypothetical protein ACFRJ1_24295 [Streptomyces sp. NPDC056773]|uniref:hypothetical protein n=1 Tax=unclassified Streptomyces TaxID=2593676 RepID=UPI0036A6ACF3